MDKNKTIKIGKKEYKVNKNYNSQSWVAEFFSKLSKNEVDQKSIAFGLLDEKIEFLGVVTNGELESDFLKQQDIDEIDVAFDNAIEIIGGAASMIKKSQDLLTQWASDIQEAVETREEDKNQF